MRIIVAECDPAVADAIGKVIRDAGEYAYITESGDDALSAAQLCGFDALIVGVTTDLSSMDIVRIARARKLATMIIALVDGGPNERKRRLDLGADDCMEREPDMDELMARLRAIVRRAHGLAAPIVVVGDLSIDLTTKKFMVLGAEVPLRSKEHSFLRLLMLRKEMVAKTSVFLHLYNGEREPDSRALDTLVFRIRQKIIEAGGSTIPETVWGYGYILRGQKKQQNAAA